jgi:hypothetical protein
MKKETVEKPHIYFHEDSWVVVDVSTGWEIAKGTGKTLQKAIEAAMETLKPFDLTNPPVGVFTDFFWINEVSASFKNFKQVKLSENLAAKIKVKKQAEMPNLFL